MKRLSSLFALLAFLLCPAARASTEPEADSLVYFSAWPIQPERVRVGHDLVQWRIGDQYFEPGPDFPEEPGPILIGTPTQIQNLNRAYSTSVKTFGGVRGFEALFPESCAPPIPAGAKGAINITNGYHDEEAVGALLTQFETNFPSLAKRYQIGSTHWGRPIWTLKISDNVATEEPEPRVVIDANIHAREYVGPEVALDIIWQLLYGYTNNTTFANWVNGMEIYVVPCLNPDGRYFCDTVTNIWRKNGRDNDHNGIISYYSDGVDLNRNSSFDWGYDNTGSSPYTYDYDYRGPSPASEPEIQAYEALIQRIRPGATLSLHTFWGVFYGPYGNYELDMPDPDPFRVPGDYLVAACTNEDGSIYEFKSGPEFGYSVNGDRADANYGLYGIQAYGIELGVNSHQPNYATVTLPKLVPGVRSGWQRFLAAAYTNWPMVRGWALDAGTGQPAPVRLHSLNLTSRPYDEHWNSRTNGYFECPLPTAGTYRIVVTPLGQESLITTQTIVVGSTAKQTNLVFDVAPVLNQSSTAGILTWSNQNENGQSLLEYAATPAGPWLPWQTMDTHDRDGQVDVSGMATTRLLRVRTAPRRFPANTNMIFVPSGAFQMGDDAAADTNEQPAAAITLDAFAIDAREVTYSNWVAVRAWATNNGYTYATGQCGVVAGGGPASSSNHPVVKIGWHDAVKFCNARSQYEGLLPAYYTTAGQTNIYKSNTVDLTTACVNWEANGYRLPTEAEWEKAARGGRTGYDYPWGIGLGTNDANWAGSGINGTTPVGSYASYGYGIYDTVGNVSEWCWDWFGSYTDRTDSNPTGPASGTTRVVRGGSWSNAPAGLRCAARAYLAPASSNTVIGLRCIRR